ncbi:uncharacterized protein BcabD6B2_24960 [Babesia caballi]|uniref:Uncharacterized protein n=1 Tax=Babesia caballi TaxID=5871 RepID=A0AAV4LSC6_BABCB|nr:hypothetical protein BcabD6B2_24960 [Babesia caballi]
MLAKTHLETVDVVVGETGHSALDGGAEYVFIHADVEFVIRQELLQVERVDETRNQLGVLLLFAAFIRLSHQFVVVLVVLDERLKGGSENGCLVRLLCFDDVYHSVTRVGGRRQRAERHHKRPKPSHRVQRGSA